MTLEYTYGKKQQLALMYHQGKSEASDACARYYQKCILYWILYVFGGWLAYKAESMMGIAVFGWMLVYTMYRQMPYSKVLQETWESYVSGVKERHIELSFDASGLTEKECGVTSFCPWHSVNDYTLFDGVLVIEMKSGQSAVIDQSTFRSDDQNLEGILSELENQKIPFKS